MPKADKGGAPLTRLAKNAPRVMPGQIFEPKINKAAKEIPEGNQIKVAKPLTGLSDSPNLAVIK